MTSADGIPSDFAIRARVCLFIASLANTLAPAESDHQSHRGVPGPPPTFPKNRLLKHLSKVLTSERDKLALAQQTRQHQKK